MFNVLSRRRWKCVYSKLQEPEQLACLEADAPHGGLWWRPRCRVGTRGFMKVDDTGGWGTRVSLGGHTDPCGPVPEPPCRVTGYGRDGGVPRRTP